MISHPRFLAAIAILASTTALALAEWPTLHGNSRHTGYVQDILEPPWRLAWIRHFDGDRLGTSMEPIVASGRVFVATHGGNVYALDAGDGRPVWRFQTHGACLQSPAYHNGLVIAGSTDGRLYAIDADSGTLRWVLAGQGGFAASPVVADQAVFIGSRTGEFLAVALNSGELLWRYAIPAPVRQTAAVAMKRVFVTSEDMRVHCLDSASGERIWTSPTLSGQTARDYYPVIVEARGRAYVIVRSNPLLNMATHIARDQTMLSRNAGVEDGGWEKVDAWVKSPDSRGSPELWEQEQQAIIRHLQEHRDARTFFVLDAGTGEEALTAPVLWVGGCQSVGTMPALTRDGRLLVLHRSAYGNWNLGVAPLVALGLLDLERNRIEPLEHQHGRQPPWNTFWGTADESQNFTVAGDIVLIVHQGTLSGFDFRTSALFTIWGNRDTYGGLTAPGWARNEWHGPGRGSVAVSGNRAYWMTGSRVLCLVAGEKGRRAEDVAVIGSEVPLREAPHPPAPTETQLRERLRQAVRELLAQPWSPLYVEPGLSGRDFSFDQSGDTFEALAWSYPHLTQTLQEQTKSFLAKEWSTRPPFTQDAWYSLREGASREAFWTPPEVRSRLSHDKSHHPFGNTYAIVRYADRCGEWARVLDAWPRIKATYHAFSETGWRLDGAKGDLYANRYLASLLALSRIAEKAGDAETAQLARSGAALTTEALAAWWKRAAASSTMASFKGPGELDPFIGRGDAISFRVAPHRHKVALFRDLTPEVAQLIKAREPKSVARVWTDFNLIYQTWAIVGEERQAHFGENYIDPPDLNFGGFLALVWLNGASQLELSRAVDVPFCRADLFHLTKLALSLEK